MKKALIVLLILAVAGGLFAQTFSGGVTTGALFTFDGEDNPVAADDDDGHAAKARLSFTNGGDDWGITVGANADVTKVDAETGEYTITGFGLGDAYGWVKFANIFKLSAGKGQGGVWQVTDWIDRQIGGSDAGARLEVTPIDGLNLGVVFGYPNHGVSAGKIANFLQETGIGANFDAGVVVVGTQIEFFSEETTDYPELDANWMFDLKVPIVGLFDIFVDGYIDNLTGKKADQDILIGEKIAGSVAGLSYNVWAKEQLSADPLTVTAGAGLEYSIPISDKATATLGADAGLTILDEFSFDTWDLYAKLAYAFNGNVSTFFKFKIDGVVDPSKVTPTLQWNIGYSF